MSEQAPSQGLTRREMIRKGALLGGTVMWVTPIVQTVGMSRALAQTPSDTCTEQFAASVRASGQGTRRDGQSIALNDPIGGAPRTNPDNATGDNDRIFSLGFKLPGHPPGGFIELEFAERAYSTTGSEVVVIETTIGRDDYPEESAEVFVSQDGISWGSSIGTASSKNADGVTMLSFPQLWIKFVRLVDITPLENFPTPTYDNADGFDVRAVKVACP